MKKVIVTFYTIDGMSTEYFSDSIMIGKPYGKIEKVYKPGQDIDDSSTVEQVIQLFKSDYRNELDTYAIENMNLKRVYIYSNDMFLGLLYDKKILEVMRDMSCEKLNIVFLYVPGGASAEFSGFKFVVHPREDIHKDNPHVHVRKAEYETRYSLNTLERFPEDECCSEFKKKEKKIIIPYLREHKEEFMRLWNYYLNGYTSPEITIDGKQIYPES